MDKLVTLPMYVQVAEAAKLKAEAAYNIAKQYMDTPAQKAAEEKARIAYLAAKEHCKMTKEYLADAEDMNATAGEVINQSMVAMEAS